MAEDMGEENLERMEKDFYKKQPDAPSRRKGPTLRRKSLGRKVKIGKKKH